MPRAAVRPISDYERVAGDFYAESPWSSAAIFALERFPGLLCDPALGIGTIASMAAAANSAVEFVGSDIVDRGAPRWCFSFRADFLDEDAWRDGLIAERGRPDVDCIVSNPPFNLAQRFITRALAVARFKVAMLLPLAYLEGDKRSRWLETLPLARVWVSRSRVGLRPGGKELATDGGTKAYGWFVFEHGWAGPPQIRWFSKPREVVA